MSVAPLTQISVGVVVERRKAASPWIDFTWRAVSVLPGEPVAAPWTQLSAEGDVASFYAGATDVALYRSETAHYRDNLAATPSLWVALRPTGVEPPYELVAVTADPAEGEGFTQNGDIWSKRCRCRKRCARWSRPSSPSTTSKGRSSSASATAPIRRRWRGARRCRGIVTK